MHAGSTDTDTGGATETATRSRRGGRDASSRNGRSGGGAQYESPGSGPAIASSSAAASATVRVIGPEVARPSDPAPNGAGETRPRDGLRPNSPQQEAGLRIEPPPSLP